jgi:hypothetical protein
MDFELIAIAVVVVLAGLSHAWLWHRRVPLVGAALVGIVAVVVIGGTIQLFRYVKGGGSEADAYQRLLALLMLFGALPLSAYLGSLAAGTFVLKLWRGLVDA